MKSDIDLADASGGVVFGFNVSLPEAVVAYANQRGVEVRSYSADRAYALSPRVIGPLTGHMPPPLAPLVR
eukprot:743278-Pyramimonas_sp.AAC.1